MEWSVGAKDCWSNGLLEQWIVGAMDCWSNGLLEQWISKTPSIQNSIDPIIQHSNNPALQ